MRSILLSAACLAVGLSTAMANEDAILASCKQDLRLSDSGCQCVLEKTGEFNEKQMAMFVAMITKDQAGMMKLQGELTGNEMQNLATRMAQIPSECS